MICTLICWIFFQCALPGFDTIDEAAGTAFVMTGPVAWLAQIVRSMPLSLAEALVPARPGEPRGKVLLWVVARLLASANWARSLNEEYGIR